MSKGFSINSIKNTDSIFTKAMRGNYTGSLELPNYTSIGAFETINVICNNLRYKNMFTGIDVNSYFHAFPLASLLTSAATPINSGVTSLGGGKLVKFPISALNPQPQTRVKIHFTCSEEYNLTPRQLELIKPFNQSYFSKFKQSKFGKDLGIVEASLLNTVSLIAYQETLPPDDLKDFFSRIINSSTAHYLNLIKTESQPLEKLMLITSAHSFISEVSKNLNNPPYIRQESIDKHVCLLANELKILFKAEYNEIFKEVKDGGALSDSRIWGVHQYILQLFWNNNSPFFSDKIISAYEEVVEKIKDIKNSESPSSLIDTISNSSTCLIKLYKTLITLNDVKATNQIYGTDIEKISSLIEQVDIDYIKINVDQLQELRSVLEKIFFAIDTLPKDARNKILLSNIEKIITIVETLCPLLVFQGNTVNKYIKFFETIGELELSEDLKKRINKVTSYAHCLRIFNDHDCLMSKFIDGDKNYLNFINELTKQKNEFAKHYSVLSNLDNSFSNAFPNFLRKIEVYKLIMILNNKVEENSKAKKDKPHSQQEIIDTINLLINEIKSEDKTDILLRHAKYYAIYAINDAFSSTESINLTLTHENLESYYQVILSKLPQPDDQIELLDDYSRVLYNLRSIAAKIAFQTGEQKKEFIDKIAKTHFEIICMQISVAQKDCEQVLSGQDVQNLTDQELEKKARYLKHLIKSISSLPKEINEEMHDNTKKDINEYHSFFLLGLLKIQFYRKHAHHNPEGIRIAYVPSSNKTDRTIMLHDRSSFNDKNRKEKLKEIDSEIAIIKTELPKVFPVYSTYLKSLEGEALFNFLTHLFLTERNYLNQNGADVYGELFISYIDKIDTAFVESLKDLEHLPVKYDNDTNNIVLNKIVAVATFGAFYTKVKKVEAPDEPIKRYRAILEAYEYFEKSSDLVNISNGKEPTDKAFSSFGSNVNILLYSTISVMNEMKVNPEKFKDNLLVLNSIKLVLASRNEVLMTKGNIFGIDKFLFINPNIGTTYVIPGSSEGLISYLKEPLLAKQICHFYLEESIHYLKSTSLEIKLLQQAQQEQERKLEETKKIAEKKKISEERKKIEPKKRVERQQKPFRQQELAQNNKPSDLINLEEAQKTAKIEMAKQAEQQRIENERIEKEALKQAEEKARQDKLARELREKEKKAAELKKRQERNNAKREKEQQQIREEEARKQAEEKAIRDKLEKERKEAEKLYKAKEKALKEREEIERKIKEKSERRKEIRRQKKSFNKSVHAALECIKRVKDETLGFQQKLQEQRVEQKEIYFKKLREESDKYKTQFPQSYSWYSLPFHFKLYCGAEIFFAYSNKPGSSIPPIVECVRDKYLTNNRSTSKYNGINRLIGDLNTFLNLELESNLTDIDKSLARLNRINELLSAYYFQDGLTLQDYTNLFAKINQCYTNLQSNISQNPLEKQENYFQELSKLWQRKFVLEQNIINQVIEHKPQDWANYQLQCWQASSCNLQQNIQTMPQEQVLMQIEYVQNQIIFWQQQLQILYSSPSIAAPGQGDLEQKNHPYVPDKQEAATHSSRLSTTWVSRVNNNKNIESKLPRTISITTRDELSKKTDNVQPIIDWMEREFTALCR